MSIPFQRSVSLSTLNDLWCTAIEGGINYWADFGKSTEAPNFKRNYEIYYSNLDNILQGGDLAILDAETGELLGILNKQGISDGFSKLPSSRLKDILNGDYDVEDADVWFQLTIFDEITFG
jgi:hypothetical protein